MSTEALFAEPTFPPITSPRGSNKRKRGPSGSPAASRASPMTRRGQYAGQAANETPIAPAPSMNDTASHTFLEGNGPDYNLPSLAPNPNTGMSAVETNNIDTAARALNYSMQVPQHPAEAFLEEHGSVGDDQTGYDNNTSTEEAGALLEQMQQPAVESAVESADGEDGMGAGDKPQVGSAEYTRLKKDNHKEVERRRRETINEGINEIAKIIPCTEKNKGSILARAVSYIHKLHEEASQNIDKWTFEKLVTEQAINDLSGKLHRAWEEKEAWKRLAKEAGVDVDTVDLGLGKDEDREGEDDDESSADDLEDLTGVRETQTSSDDHRQIDAA